MRRLVVLGCNHTSATLTDVGHCRIEESSVGTVLPALRDRLGAHELIYLPTCHRTEWYAAYDTDLCPGRLTMQLARALPELTSGAAELPPLDRCLTLQGRHAAEHLFTVAAALDSLMVGEAQILGQVKAALRQGKELGLAGPFLTTLFSQAFRAAKRVRTETSLARRPVSLVTLAQHKLRAALQRNSDPVIVLGAGEMAAHAIAMIRKIDGARKIVVCNRSPRRGRSLARRVGASYKPLVEFTSAPDRCCVLVAATSSPEPIVTRETATALAGALLLDLGVPANIADDCETVDGIEVVAQRSLESEANANRAARAREIEAASEIIRQQLDELAYELMEHELSPVARRLLSRFREVTRAELVRAVEHCAPARRADIDEMADRLSRRLVRVPMRGLREVAWLHSTAVLATFLSAVEQ